MMRVSIEEMDLIIVFLGINDPWIWAVFFLTLPEKSIAVNIVVVLRQGLLLEFGHKQDYVFCAAGSDHAFR